MGVSAKGVKSKRPRLAVANRHRKNVQLNVFGHDGDAFGVDGAQVGVFKQPHKVGLGGFLESKNSRRLEAEFGLEILGNFTDEALEGRLADQEFGGLLVLADFAEGDGSGAVAMGLQLEIKRSECWLKLHVEYNWISATYLLDASSSGSGLARSLGRELLARGLASGGFTSGLLGASHGCCMTI